MCRSRSSQSSDSYPTAYILKSEDIETIWECFDQHFGSTKAIASCRDGVSREFDTLLDLVSYQNDKGKEIFRLSIESRKDEYSANMLFHDGLVLGSSLDISASESVLAEVRDLCISVVARTKPWYAFLATFNVYWVITAVAVVLWGDVILDRWAYGELSSNSADHSIFSIALVLAISGTFIIIIFKGFFWLESLQRKYFPVALIAIGDVARRMGSDNIIRIIIIGIFFAIVIYLFLFSFS